MITNHSDAAKTVMLELINDGRADLYRVFTIGALRIRSDGASGGIEAKAVIVAERPISRGSSRQEVDAVPKEDYHAKETYFIGVRHSAGTGAYTNVGITRSSGRDERPIIPPLCSSASARRRPACSSGWPPA